MATSTLAVPQSAGSSAAKTRNRNTDPLSLSFPNFHNDPDPLKVALSGFPDVNSYFAYYEGAEHDID